MINISLTCRKKQERLKPGPMWALVLMLVLLCVPFRSVFSDDKPDRAQRGMGSVSFSIAGRAMTGESTDITVDSGYAYVATATGLLILDVSSPDSIQVISHTYIDPQDASFCDSHIFKLNQLVLFTNLGALHVFDVSDPHLPLLVAFYDQFGNNCIGDVVANGSFIYLATEATDQIHILSLAGSVTSFNAGDVSEMYLQNDHDPPLLFVATGDEGDLNIYSILDPWNPVLLGTFNGTLGGRSIFVQDTIAYFANYSPGLSVLSVSDLGHIRELGTFDGSIFSVVAEGDHAYTSSRGYGFKVLDVSEPRGPVQVGEGSPGGHNLQVKDGTLYIAQPKSFIDNIGVHIFDVSVPEYPAWLGAFVAGSNFNDITEQNGWVYASGTDFGIQIYPDDGVFNPDDIRRVLPYNQPEEMVFFDDISFLLSFSGVHVLDWLAPDLPGVLQFIPTSYEAQEVEWQDTVLFVACGVEGSISDFPGELQIYNVEDLANPILLSSFVSPYSPFFDMEIYGQYAFIVDIFEGIRAFDIGDVTHPVEVASLPGSFNRILVNDTLAFLSANSSIHIFGLGGAPELTPISECDISSGEDLQEMFIHDNLLFTFDSRHVYAFDVSNPIECELVGEIQLPDYIQDCFLREDRMFVSTYSLGTFILTYETGPTIVEQDDVLQATRMALFQNYPNPFNPATTIRFSIPKSGEVSLRIFNLLGEEVTTLLSGPRHAGTHSVEWDATGQTSGVYFYRLLTNDFVQTRKLVLLR